jgi:tetratricopeptide (TPR) repeat protein
MEVSAPDDDAAGAPRPAQHGTSAGAAGRAELGTTSEDAFLAAAAKEYQEGHIDQALWARASAQSGDDESLQVAAYLRARATALQLEKRQRRLERRAKRGRSRQPMAKHDVAPEPEVLPAQADSVKSRGLQPTLKYFVAAATATATAAAAAWLVVSPQQHDPSVQPSLSAGQSAPASLIATNSNSGTSLEAPVPTVEAEVRRLKDAGNWNVLVFYAAKWTREEPNNAAAWSELSIGYANLRQFDDALAAGARAAELSPDDALLWRNLGHLNLTLERLPEAGSAFDRSLELRADDTDAQCGSAMVAHKLGRTKEAEAISRQVRSAEGNCPAMGDGENVAVAVGHATARKPASSAGR